MGASVCVDYLQRMDTVRTSELFRRVGQVSGIRLDHTSVINKPAGDKNGAL